MRRHTSLLCDSNVWLALSLEEHPHHSMVHDWFLTERSPASIFFCRATQRSFLRLLTTASVLRSCGAEPRTNHQAWEVFEELVSDYRIGFIESEPSELQIRWKGFTDRETVSPKLWMDAYLASFAVAGSHCLVTTDRGFKQFAGLDLLLLAQPN